MKIENPKGGDEGRYAYEPVEGVPILFVATNRNKKGITLDIRQEDGRALYLRLLPHFDVLVENFAGGTLERWGLAPKDLCRDHPRLIVASLSGFEQTGPWRDRPSYDIITGAYQGASITSTVVTHVKFVGPDVAVADAEAELAGLRGSNGNALAPIQAQVVFGLVKQGERWVISSIRGVTRIPVQSTR